MGAGPEDDADKLEDTDERSTKTFMFPDRRTATATKKMMLKHKLRDGAREMNIVPGMHTSLIGIPKLADAGYTTVLRGDGAEIYDDITTSMVWVSSSISHCFSNSILPRPHEIVGGCWDSRRYPISR